MIDPITNDHPGEWHQQRFREFGDAKVAIGEPVPHMALVTHLSKGQPSAEQMWRAGCYLAGYSVLTGEAIWTSWSFERVKAEADDLLPWVTANWAGFHTRKPRRCVRTPKQFVRCLLSFAEWIENELPALLKIPRTTAHRAVYDKWWKSGETIEFFGRYITIRLLELSRRWGLLDAGLYDIRAIGAHSPIRCLMLLRPDKLDELSTGDPKLIDPIAEEVKQVVGPDMSYFLFATLLCEYRACYEDAHDYVGNQHDEELEYTLSKYADYWKSVGHHSRIYEARAAVDKHECLGEIQGWTHRRTDVAALMRQRGVVWSDLVYDYNATVKANYKLVERDLPLL